MKQQAVNHGEFQVSTTKSIIDLPLHQQEQHRIDQQHHRWMEETTDLACFDYYDTSYNGTLWDDGSNTTDIDDSVSGVSCEPIGQIKYEDAALLYQQFCPNWPFTESTVNPSCDLGDAVEEVLLSCNNRKTRVLGGEYFPDGGFPDVEGEVRDETKVPF